MLTRESWPRAFGAVVQRERRRLRMTQDGVARKAGITGRAVSMYEAGERAPGSWPLMRIAAALDMSVCELLAEASEVAREGVMS